jgi:rare lipoprotein A
MSLSIRRIAALWAMVCMGCAHRSSRNFERRGLASFYSNALAGRRTASGERYDPQRFTAAHRTASFQSCLRVTLLRTGRSVEVTVNDRGPFVSGRIIDLSWAAAQTIDLRGVEAVTLSLCR